MSFRTETLAEGVTLHLGDCLEVLPTLGRFDAVVTDPPYGIGESSKKAATRGKLAAAKDYGGQEDWDKVPADPRVIDWVRANSDTQVIFGGNYFHLPPSSCWLVWDKQNGDNDFADCELAWTNMPKAVRRINWMWNGMLRKGKEDRVHLTQKPLGVMEWTLGHLPRSVRSVCDPYMGSGTTGVACVKRGLHFVGIEKAPNNFDIACGRIDAALREPSLLVEPPKPAQQLTFDTGEAA
jgi:DNA modification methylase